MTIEEHARTIEAAIQAAAADGFELDDTHGNPVHLELNRVTVDGVLCVTPPPVRVRAPATY
ncbi:hypothetical protein ACFW08_05785 [Streptomyces sp. NPDC058960]|uniref:hypothetical protein n=1 Tax=Streptomyces sp. NPDC058960 TaxID=3346679 RepID=UPI0036C21939